MNFMVNVIKHLRNSQPYFVIVWNGRKIKAFKNRKDAEKYMKNIILDNLDVMEIKEVMING